MSDKAQRGENPGRFVRGLGPIFLLLVGGLIGVLVMMLLRQNGRHTNTESHAVVEGVRRILHVSTVEMQISDYQVRRDSKDLWGFLPITCEKTVVAFYRGKISAGFSLDDHAWAYAVDADEQRHVLRVKLPPAQIMSVDVKPPELFLANGSVCNGIEPADYQRLHEDARRAAERAAIGNGILIRAEAHARQILTELAKPLGWQLELTVDRVEAPPKG